MRYSPSRLVYHTLHARPMRGYLPFFFIPALVVVVGVILLFEVRVQPPVRPQGVGVVLYKNDELTRFRVRQSGALPLHLPRSVDPAEQIVLPKSVLPTRREVTLLPAPAEDFLSDSCREVLPDDGVLPPDLQGVDESPALPVAPSADKKEVSP